MIPKEFKLLSDDKKDLYIFTKKVISDELIDLLKEHHEVRQDAKEKITYIKLVPSYDYFLSFNKPNRSWFYKDKVYVTKEQVDKFITLNLVMPISFIDFIFLENEK